MDKKKRLLILYDWFYPGFRAGGPIQSLTNLVIALQQEFEMYVITGAYDLNANIPYNGININSWNEVYLQETDGPVRIFYGAKYTLSLPLLKKIIKFVNPDTIYFNGLFSYHFFVLPLLAIRINAEKIKIIVCPRGMLKAGALAGKSIKKKIYLSFLLLSGLLKNVYWHATNREEADNIREHFKINKGIVIASNIPKIPYQQISFPNKAKDHLKLVSLSLINEHKNILLLIQLISTIHSNITLDIYGPVIDEPYWKKCLTIINEFPDRIKYMGTVQPTDVQEVLSNYHALILCTKGENFGHSIYESFSVGRPVITSHFTPWNNLDVEMAGVNMDISNITKCRSELNRFCKMEKSEFDEYCIGAHNIALQYFKKINPKMLYYDLFS